MRWEKILFELETEYSLASDTLVYEIHTVFWYEIHTVFGMLSVKSEIILILV